jgi:hypothetical protein
VVGAREDHIPECEVDLRVGGRIYIVMEAARGMGKYQGTRWPMEGTFTHIEQPTAGLRGPVMDRGEQDSSTIEHVNEVQLSEVDGQTVVNLRITVTDIGPGRRWPPRSA